MPTVSVGRDRLFAALEQTYTDQEFDELCFEFGIELDDVTTEKEVMRKEKHVDEEASSDEEIIYKIDVPANRYDLLCLEGLAKALRIFTGKDPIPTFRLSDIPRRSVQKMVVKPETSSIRPFVVCAVLRGVTFDEARYNSFIDLQDKLHQNLCRRRTLVAIGTHDLDVIEGPFTYEALPPIDIKFAPLKQTKEFNGADLMEFYKSDLKLKKFLHIIESSPVYPVIYDSKRRVLSLPPIINGAHSAISLKTKNVFIECTATDLTKAKIVLNTMVTTFSQYSSPQFEVEPVEVISADGKSALYPDLSLRTFEVDMAYINRIIGTSLGAKEVANLLNKMQLQTEVQSDSRIRVSAPPTRSDVLHACDVAEDVAIAYGYNNISRTVPRSHTQGKQQPLNHFTDLIRAEVAMAGFTEVVTWILCSREENFTMVNRKDDGNTAVIIGNPRTADFEVVRSSLLPGMLKTMGSNKDAPRPLKLFEVSDIVRLDSKKDVGAVNSRHLAAIYSNMNSGFEVIHGLIDRVFEVLGVRPAEFNKGSGTYSDDGYHIVPSQEPEYFSGRQANIIYAGSCVGSFGIVNPEVMLRFDITDPCSAVELNIEPFLHL
ncbi:phenylalanine--tRNA ligase beta subunit, cytoplasmic [Physcomitrium patens]|uniref:phenylalanine--tRNA ligase n=1 Tax=Physcomitrium patens TaxID=3218 RepID=A9SET8_PHYPA|nr:phenylalanine--tRNA ligase beta subunit, cytoplasmic-like [Physcomitrium patens]XP_024360083.1 phenylalanine--tRNA ligase beta subunit, cytoplasmic-like [Physcomitrium patens]XP_024360084.1 phenylalanine--tRNA ligase beta subunit, cytoplasmic-like [Physcomitrium patens]PNR30871.1 hypothetical protein PHYPA_027187 [Physcomitrium patens]|eukprot:XP_024360082.1 phenylalanine--tRNA ligase beta subunit, cytoplasmic-like [Physcomitrella patens]